jgi:hypothetical protein
VAKKALANASNEKWHESQGDGARTGHRLHKSTEVGRPRGADDNDLVAPLP